MSKRRDEPIRQEWWQSTTVLSVTIAILVLILAGTLYAIVDSKPYDAPTQGGADVRSDAVMDGDVQVLRMSATDRGYVPSELHVKAGTPVRWIVTNEARGCAQAFVVPELGISQILAKGENVFEFTPSAGRIEFSCSMHMYTGVIVAS